MIHTSAVPVLWQVDYNIVPVSVCSIIISFDTGQRVTIPSAGKVYAGLAEYSQPQLSL